MINNFNFESQFLTAVSCETVSSLPFSLIATKKIHNLVIETNEEKEDKQRDRERDREREENNEVERRDNEKKQAKKHSPFLSVN